jgi:hypothetical protein
VKIESLDLGEPFPLLDPRFEEGASAATGSPKRLRSKLLAALRDGNASLASSCAHAIRIEAEALGILADHNELSIITAARDYLGASEDRDRRVAEDEGALRHPIVIKQFRDFKVKLEGRSVIKKLFPTPSLAMVYGESGSGKTYFVGNAALCVASRDRDCLGMKTRHGLVVYIGAEAAASVEQRFAAQRSELGIEDANLVLLSGPINLLDRDFVRDLVGRLAVLHATQGPLAMVVIDTLAAAAPGGDENAAETMSEITSVGVRIRDLFDCVAVLVHHAGKDRQRGARGHSSLRAAVDVEIEVTHAQGLRCATVRKNRDGETDFEVPFRLRPIVLGKDEDGDDVTTCVVEAVNDGSKPRREQRAAKLPAAASLALDALREVACTKGKASTATSTVPAGKTLVSIEDWRDQFRLRYGTDGQDAEAVKKAFQRARERLAGDRMVGISGGQAWLW